MGSLSGGELARVQLARLHCIRADLLILDEPTNHLDALSREAVEEALEDFSGTILAVSHDRYFLDKTVDRVIEVSDRRLISHPGGFSDWWADRGMATSAGRVTTRKKEKTRTPGRRGAGTPGISRERVSDIESRIERLETEKKDLESRMKKVLARGDHQSARALGKKLDGSNKRLKEAWAIWEEVIQDS
jgi:ATP-binding cassette subfamily F protein 3